MAKPGGGPVRTPRVGHEPAMRAPIKPGPSDQYKALVRGEITSEEYARWLRANAEEHARWLKTNSRLVGLL